MIHRLLTRCPRRVLCTPAITRTGYPRYYARQVQKTTQNEPVTYWEKRVTVYPRRAIENGWDPRPRVEDGVLTVSTEVQHKQQRIPIPGRWLRDNCACSECRNPETAQRRINVLKNPEAGKVVTAVKQDAAESPKHTKFDLTFADGHQSTISAEFIRMRQNESTSSLRYGYVEPQYWTADIASSPPTVDHEAIQQKTGMADLLANIKTFGFCFVDNMPATPEATRELLEQIGPIRNTHYGGFYDFTSDLSSKDTAYTSESLEPHTDTTYFTEPIGLQALHLLSHTDGEGGLSSLVDGFGAADALWQNDFPAYQTLSQTKVYAHASGNEGVSIQPAQAFPVLNHSPELSGLTQVRWNTADRAGLDASLGPSTESWYDAAAQFDALLSHPDNVYWFQLKPGKMLIFDNWRVLHGRSAFTGKRRMCGGYINRDDFISKYRMTNLTKEQIAASTVTG
ncbi:hypothetical protein Q7P35_009111 [Cladosporium inversicolor]